MSYTSNTEVARKTVITSHNFGSNEINGLDFYLIPLSYFFKPSDGTLVSINEYFLNNYSIILNKINLSKNEIEEITEHN